MAIEVGRDPVLGRLGWSASALSESALSASAVRFRVGRGLIGGRLLGFIPTRGLVSFRRLRFGIGRQDQRRGRETAANSIAMAEINVSLACFQN